MNVYVVVARLFNAGDQVPLIAFIEVVGKAASGSPEQIAATGLNVGVVDAFTFIMSVVVVAHCPAVGVKVYVVVARLFNAGDQVPLIPFVDVVGKAASGSPEQIPATGLNVGVVDEFTFIVSVVVVAHCPTVGVKV